MRPPRMFTSAAVATPWAPSNSALDAPDVTDVSATRALMLARRARDEVILCMLGFLSMGVLGSAFVGLDVAASEQLIHHVLVQSAFTVEREGEAIDAAPGLAVVTHLREVAVLVPVAADRDVLHSGGAAPLAADAHAGV